MAAAAVWAASPLGPVAALPAAAQARAEAAPNEPVTNGDFTDGTNGWVAVGGAAMGAAQGGLSVDVRGGTAQVWDAMVAQSGIKLRARTSYVLSFDASASAPVDITATVQLADKPYTNTLTRAAGVKAATTRYSYPFTSTLDTDRGQVTFQLGGHPAVKFTLDNVSLVEVRTPLGPSGPLSLASGFYVDPDAHAAAWVRGNKDDPRAPAIDRELAHTPTARWFGEWSGEIGVAVGGYVGAADAVDRLPVLVAYNLPDRDACGGHSDGGTGDVDAYQKWISAFASSIGGRPAIVVIEPDAFGDFECMTPAEAATRRELLTFATEQFRDRAPNTWAYLDGGNAGWVNAATMAARMNSAGLRNVHGFAVNVSNYYTDQESATYATNVNNALAAYGYRRPFVIDSSRNGNGAVKDPSVKYPWCNPAGRRLGVPTQVGGAGAELRLWVKVPGDSDGLCGIAVDAPAGTFRPDIAVRLIEGR
ncbi:glycoside hydrolase family 6 protein [Actinoplanes sp. NPDC051346]|uniref:glycoside hydrolase family 6 protein n=1 Tax=Actinoplanes sp. NPDC051346 TaxID=3155048 RepID=UPI003442CDB2